MWICTKCGEPHQDQFKECWKCVGAEMESSDQVTAEPPRSAPPAPERRLRSLGSIVARAAVGFLVGILFSLSSLKVLRLESILPIPELSTAGRSTVALAVGAVFAVLVGLFFWVVLPYESTGSDQEPRT